ncbi:hypothetical protein [Bacillus sp. OTU530]|uniref:hypothetical protein n=1 Tax=Bacillus sp. OTU530 TaxID=3043862 RepID=UPI00313E2889
MNIIERKFYSKARFYSFVITVLLVLTVWYATDQFTHIDLATLGYLLSSIIVNVISLQHTIEAYYGREYGAVATCMIVSIASVIVALTAYINWRKLEYN